MKENKIKDRDSNLELLRILSMLLIISFHVFRHSDEGVDITFIPLSINKFFLMALGSWGIVGVDCLVLISSWFMLEKGFSAKRWIRVVVQTALYSVIIYFVIHLLTRRQLSAKGLIKSIISFAYGDYWFVTAYLVLLLFTPVINSFVCEMTDDALRYTVNILFFLCCVWKFAIWNSPMDTVWLFVFLYIFTAYLKRKGKNSWFYKNRLILLCTGMLLVLGFGIIISLLPDPIRTSIVVKFFYTALLTKWSPISLLIATAMFFCFFKLQIKSHFINYIASRSFSAYLIHENVQLYPVMWGSFWVVSNHISKTWFGVWYVGVVLGIYSASIIIDCCLKFMYTPISDFIYRIPLAVKFESAVNECFKNQIKS